MHVTLMSTRTLVALSAGALLLTGCGSGTSAAARTAADLRGKLPQPIRNAGVLKIGSDLNYAPVDFKGTEGVPDGLDPNLAAALGAYLGLRIEFVDMPFEKLIPAVQAKQVDLAMSAIIDTRQRQEGTDLNGRQVNPGVDFIDYFITGTSILVRNGNPVGISSLDSLCGHTIALQRGTIQDEIATRQIAACGKVSKPLQIHRLDTDDQALAEVALGVAVADLNDYPVAEYNTSPARRGDRFQVTGGQFQTGPYALTLNKESTALRYVLSKALDQLIRNGEYDKILAKWNVPSGAVTSALVNGGL
ncbi:ABC transporter substrate-binding protein [Kitasatospora atroaurantiaca]|uniref:Amino acid ABC transporter substrate-binding protein (PAAT family) n=2 Tax=Kitasatospora atroaurantiaca TaxID=285545 RepID=A0A561EI83_9ACTN|nr:amino acid ABC transporter substrate-binding protein (PAAT family) [Kitasatospora atroaurantiaca]